MRLELAVGTVLSTVRDPCPQLLCVARLRLPVEGRGGRGWSPARVPGTRPPPGSGACAHVVTSSRCR